MLVFTDSLAAALQSFANEFFALLHPMVLLVSFLSVIGGILVGALPGLTATMAVSLLVGLTYGVDTTLALTILMGIYVGAIYGGSQAAILLNIPGTPASAASAIEGHRLALKGQAGQAIGLATLSSFVGTLIGALLVLLASPLLTSIALRFGAWEYFLLAVFGILICGTLAAENPVKGWLGGFLGLMIAMVGMEEIQAYHRFTFGQIQLTGGISLIPAMIGLFAVPEILGAFARSRPASVTTVVGSVIPSLRKFTKYLPVTLRSGLIGAAIGAIPGAGEDIAAWVSYANAKRFSKEKEKFGTGHEEGLVASEVANNTCIGGSLIPLLTLAVPGSAVAAVILGALWLHNVRPGPLLFIEQPAFFYQIVGMLVIAATFMLVGGLFAAKVLPTVLRVPAGVLMPVVAVLCVAGSFAVNMRIFDVFVMLTFGFVGTFLKSHGYTPAPIVLGLILGNMADANLRRALFLADGSLEPFFTRPISLVLILMVVLTIGSSLIAVWRGRRRPRET